MAANGAITSHWQDAGRLPAASVEQPHSQSGSHFLKVQHACLKSELDSRWRGEDGEVSVGQEGSFKLLIYIKHLFQNFHWILHFFYFNFLALAGFSFLNWSNWFVFRLSMLHALRVNVETLVTPSRIRFFPHSIKNMLHVVRLAVLFEMFWCKSCTTSCGNSVWHSQVAG